MFFILLYFYGFVMSGVCAFGWWGYGRNVGERWERYSVNSFVRIDLFLGRIGWREGGGWGMCLVFCVNTGYAILLLRNR